MRKIFSLALSYGGAVKNNYMVASKKLQRIKAQRLKGFPDFLPAAAAVRAHIVQVARQQALRAGFSIIDTPTLEYTTTLAGCDAQESSKQMYHFHDHGGRDVGLRFDLTVPFARFVAEHRGELLFPLRRLQYGNVFRGEKPQRGRYREFQQCDLDIVGTTSSAAEVEIIAMFNSILAELKPGGWRLAIGHRALLNAVVGKIFPALDAATRSEVLIVIDKLAKLEHERIVALLVEKSGGSTTQAQELLGVLPLDLDGVEQFLRHNNELESTFNNLRQTLATLQQLSAGDDGQVVFDLSIARGLDYYTGIVFETVLDDAPQLGSVCSGGRYDDLITRFAAQPCAGVGGSIGVDRLVPHLVERASSAPQAATVFIAVATTAARHYACVTAQLLRDKGISTALDVSEQSLKHQLKYAHRAGYPWVVIVGDEEQQSATVTLRNMATGTEQKNVARNLLPMTVTMAANND